MLKAKEWLKNRKTLVIVAVILFVALCCIGAYWLFFQRTTDTAQKGIGGNSGFSMGAIGDNVVTASGVVNMGVTEEIFSVSNLETTLEIEEVYISSDTEIAAGTQVLKLSEEDIAAAREELSQTLKEAELAYRAGKIEYEQSLITAKYDRDSALLEGEQAKAVYEETIAGLSNSVERAQEALDEANEQMEEYASYVYDGSYKEYFQVDEYQQVYDENLQLLQSRMEAGGYSWEQVSGGRGGSDQELTMLSSLYKILEENLKDLQQAEADYEDAVANASFELQSLELSLPSLKQALNDAKQTYETSVMQAELTYETALASAGRAESDYETAVEKAQNDFDELESQYQDAKENLELFEKLVGDGYFYASGSGTVLRTNVRAGRSLTAESTVFTYSDPESMTVTVSVSQESLSQISIGDRATVMTNMYGNYTGTVSEINPVSASSSRSNVTYSVVVTLQGDTSKIPANTAVTVLIGAEAGFSQEQPEMEQKENGRPEMNMEGQKPKGEGGK